MSNILIAPFGMFMGRQDNFGSLHFTLRRIARVDELSHIGYFIVNDLYGILWFGSTHVVYPPTFKYLTFLFSEHIYAKLYLV